MAARTRGSLSAVPVHWMSVFRDAAEASKPSSMRILQRFPSRRSRVRCSNTPPFACAVRPDGLTTGAPGIPFEQKRVPAAVHFSGPELRLALMQHDLRKVRRHLTPTSHDITLHHHGGDDLAQAFPRSGPPPTSHEISHRYISLIFRVQRLSSGPFSFEPQHRTCTSPHVRILLSLETPHTQSILVSLRPRCTAAQLSSTLLISCVVAVCLLVSIVATAPKPPHSSPMPAFRLPPTPVTLYTQAVFVSSAETAEDER